MSTNVENLEAILQELDVGLSTVINSPHSPDGVHPDVEDTFISYLIGFSEQAQARQNVPVSVVKNASENVAGVAAQKGKIAHERGDVKRAQSLYATAAMYKTMEDPRKLDDLARRINDPLFTKAALDCVRKERDALGHVNNTVAARIAELYDEAITHLQAKLHLHEGNYAAAAATYLAADMFGEPQIRFMYDHLEPSKRKEVAKHVLDSANRASASILTVIEFASVHGLEEEASKVAEETLGLIYAGRGKLDEDVKPGFTFSESDMPAVIDNPNVQKALGALERFLKEKPHAVAFVAEGLYGQTSLLAFASLAVEGNIQSGFFKSAYEMAVVCDHPKKGALERLRNLVPDPKPIGS